MGVYQYNARTDQNQAEIVAALRGVGAGVWYVRLPFDLLVGFRGRLYLLDCKTGKEGFNERQKLSLRLLEACSCTATAVHDVDEALKAIGAMEETSG
jgi:hypothetical protein